MLKHSLSILSGVVYLAHLPWNLAFVPLLHSSGARLPSLPEERRAVSSLLDVSNVDEDASAETEPLRQTRTRKRQLLIHWKGEAVDGYSLQFRHDEFRGALAAVVTGKEQAEAAFVPVKRQAEAAEAISFSNALQYAGKNDDPVMLSDIKRDAFNQAMQYLDYGNDTSLLLPSTEDCIQAVRRCSLIHALYEIVAETDGETYDDLPMQAMKNGGFDDLMMATSDGKNLTWCVRVRHYGENESTSKERRYGHRARSMALERQALQALKPLLLKFTGKVDLAQPDCKIYIFDGLVRSRTVLARRLARGPRISILDPNTRHCITNTPLGSVVAFTMNNVARIRRNSRILDPFAGSCAVLLAAALIESTVQTVGIELAHNGLVNRDDIRNDFRMRNLTVPAALIHGDCRDARIRKQAIEAVGGKPFDCIITDPPYGIRESKSTGDIEIRPIDELLQMIARDRDHGDTTRLIKKGGRLVVFLPQSEEESLHEDVLPTAAQLEAAGLQCTLMREQPLNEKLQRWLVCYECIR